MKGSDNQEQMYELKKQLKKMKDESEGMEKKMKNQED